MAIGSTPLGRMAIEVDLDSSSLRKNTTNMRNLMKSVNEEFKANMSAVKRTGSEMDILATRTNGLSKKYEAQKKVVEEMTKAYEKANEQASSDKATQKQIKDAEAKKKALNKEIATLNDLGGALQDAQREQDELAEHNKKLESTFYKLDEAMKANGSRLKSFGSMTSGIGRDMFTKLTLPILGVGAAAVKSAGDYDAAESQFSQVFGKMEGTASKSLEKISKETGLLPNSLRGSFTQIAAFAKTTGADAKTALDITSRATLAAADSAAFYDRSIEEVTESLQSYLKGNFENDAALGISSTETTRNAQANKLYSKSFKDLNEEQKQLTLLAMVEEGNKLSGALGQAARESDQLGTQTSNLKTIIKDLLSEIGKPILPLVIQGFKSLTGSIKQGIGWFTKLEESKKMMVLGLAGIVAAIPPVLIGIGLMAQGLGAIMTLGAPLALTVTAVVAGLALLAIGLTRAYKDSETFRNVVNGAFESVKKGAQTAIGTIKGLFQIFKGEGTQGVMTLSKFLPPELVVSLTQKVEIFRNIVHGAFSAVRKGAQITIGTIKGLFQLFKGNDKQGVMTLSKFLPPGLVVGLTKTVETIKTTVKSMGEAVGSAFKSIGSMLLKFWKENGAMIVQALKNVMAIVVPILSVLGKVFSVTFKVALGIAKVVVVGTFNAIVGVIKGAINVITGVIQVFSALFTGNWKKLFGGLWKITKGAIQIIWNGINLLFYGRILKGGLAFAKGFTKIFPKMFSAIKSYFKNSMNSIFEIVEKIWSKTNSQTAKVWKNIFGFLKKVLKDIFTNFKQMFTNLWEKVKDTFNLIDGFIPRKMKSIYKSFTKSMSEMWNGTKEFSKKIMKTLDDTFEKMVDGGAALPKRIGEGIKNGAGKAVDGVKHLGNKMIDKLGGVVNGTIGGINTVTDKLGIGKKVKEWKVPKFSTGTKNGALANNSLITVGDKGKGNWKGTRELVQFPNGQTHLFNDETTFHAPAGTKVFSNYETEHMLGNAPLKFSEGTGVGGFFSNMGKGIVDGFGDVMDFIKDPKSLAKKLIDGVLKRTGFGGLSNFALDMAKGGFNQVKEGVMSFITSVFEETSMGGDNPFANWAQSRGWTAHGHAGIDYAVKAGTKIPSPISGEVIQSWFSPYTPSGGNEVQVYANGFTHIFMHMLKRMVKKGDRVRQGQILGLVGNTGNSFGDHLHWQVNKGKGYRDNHPDSINPEAWASQYASKSGSKGGNWSSTVKQALKLSGLPTTSAYVNAWLSQIQSESGGNARAVQHGYVDQNTGGNEARGLVQVIPPTFNAYKLKGMNDIYNPLHNLVAGMRYAKSRYGGSMLSVIGHGHGYKTGGIVNGKQLAWLDEENKGEVVIPLNPSRRSDAMKLLAYTAMKIMPKERGGQGYRPNIPDVNIASNDTESNIVKMLAQIVRNQQEQLDRIEQQTETIRSKQYSIDKYEHEKQVIDTIEKYERTKSRIKRF